MRVYLFSLCLLVLTSCAKLSSGQTIHGFECDDDSIFVEKLKPIDTNEERFNTDNVIYKVGREFIYDYYIIREGVTKKISAPAVVDYNENWQRTWKFVDATADDPDKIDRLLLKVMPGVTNTSQTKLQYSYKRKDGSGFPFSSTSGVIENKMNVWSHPFRDKYFMIFESNPFPYIQQPYRVNNKWTWKLKVGDYWGDDRWKKWQGSIELHYEYTIVSQEVIDLAMGKLQCWKVAATATSAVGRTELISYFNEQHGFVKLDYLNIDGSRTVLLLQSTR